MSGTSIQYLISLTNLIINHCVILRDGPCKRTDIYQLIHIYNSTLEKEYGAFISTSAYLLSLELIVK